MKKLNLNLNLINENLDAETLAQYTYEFINDIRTESDISAELQESNLETHQKGDSVNFASIVLTFISSGSAIALFEVFKSYVSKDSSTQFEITKPNGEKITFNSNNLNKEQFDKVLSIIDDVKAR